MLEKIKSLFCRKKVRKPKLFQMGGGWGDAINWMDTKSRRVVGWKTPKPQKGDFLKSPMKSGKVGIFKFGAIEHCGDPHDMFFANVKDVGYEGEVKLPEFEKPPAFRSV